VIDGIQVTLPRPRDPHTIVLEDEYRDIHRRLLEAIGEGPPAQTQRPTPAIDNHGAMK
jgi:hypothetical protein